MYEFYLKDIRIERVRHLKNINIPISDKGKKHLILTGKNGSGKTSLLQALAQQLNYLATTGDFEDISLPKTQLIDAKAGLELTFNVPLNSIKSHFDNGDFVLAYYEATRKFDAVIPKHVEKVHLKDNYSIKESPRNEFVKYILDLKMTEALALTSGKTERANEIRSWFDNFEKLLKQIFEDDSISLLFDEDTFQFLLHQDGRDSFDFQSLSDGFAAILDIVVDLMIRMEKHLGGGLIFDLPGIVLIDEIETHLHLQLQRHILNFLTSVFPNVQFIVSTHSPFILNSASRTTIFDLENKTYVSSGLTNLPYDGIVSGYFEVDKLSIELREKFDRYRELVSKEQLSDDDMEEIAALELYLDEIPDYLALETTTEYRRLKLQFETRKDL